MGFEFVWEGWYSPSYFVELSLVTLFLSKIYSKVVVGLVGIVGTSNISFYFLKEISTYSINVTLLFSGFLENVFIV